ncbi:MAG: ferritin family protein [Candidatus Zixiibacteriota bacterium]|nr:MAG: ferritin family protein [candidate division Zixibacteria bacterium]
MIFNSVEEILDYAIAREQEAADFYSGLAGTADKQYMREVFEQFSREEMGHRKRIESVKAGKRLAASEKKILDLKIGDYLEPVDTASGKNLSYQEALVVAMKREKESFRLYTDLADSARDENVQSLFLSLAQEEAKHKLRFELEYDENILKEN